MYKLILVPLEVSPADETILEHITKLARACGAKLVLVHVADGFAARHQEQLNLADSEEIEQDRAYLEQVRQRLEAEGFDVETHLARGEPADEILKLAEAIGADLIAMATHGHRFVRDLISGSVASQVRHRTDIPVLLVRSRRPATRRKRSQSQAKG